MEVRKCLYSEDFSYPQSETHCHLFNAEYPDMHTHDYWEFFIIMQGTIMHKTGEKTEKISRCDLLLIRPFDLHCFRRPFEGEYEQLNVMVTDRLFKTLAEMIHPLDDHTHVHCRVKTGLPQAC